MTSSEENNWRGKRSRIDDIGNQGVFLPISAPGLLANVRDADSSVISSLQCGKHFTGQVDCREVAMIRSPRQISPSPFQRNLTRSAELNLGIRQRRSRHEGGNPAESVRHRETRRFVGIAVGEQNATMLRAKAASRCQSNIRMHSP